MRRHSLKLALGVVALALGPLALTLWNQGFGKGGFSTPIGGERWFATRPGFFEASGVRDPELSPTGSVFNWTERDARLLFTRLPRSKPSVVSLRVQGQAPTRKSQPSLVISVDGVEEQRLEMPTSPKRVTVEIPPRAGRGATVSITVEDAVGVMVENVRLAAVTGALPIPREALGALAFVAFAWYVAGLIAGMSPWLALLLAALQLTLVSWLTIRGGAFLGRYSESVAWITLAGVLLSLLSLLIKDIRWRRVMIAVLCISALKLAILAHPQIIDGDTIFHTTSLRRVLSGDWFFTSDTPPPAISFPYPPGLSVVALPFSGLPKDTWVTLLRVIVIVTETLAAASFAVAVAALSSEAVGALTFLFLALSPHGLAILFVGNLSNLFAEALLLFGCTLLITRRAFVGALALLGAFLSHFGTLLVGAPLAFALSLDPDSMLARIVRRSAPVAAAIVASFVLYYWRFLNVVVDALERMRYLKGPAATGPMTAPITEKLARLGGGDDWWITAVIAVTALVGMAAWPRSQKVLARVLFVWLVVVLGFTLLGLVTPVQVRTGLTARPALAVLWASGLCAMWAGGRWQKAIALALALGLAVGSWVVAIHFFPARAL